MKFFFSSYSLLPATLVLGLLACNGGRPGGNGGTNDSTVVMNSPQKALEAALNDLQQLPEAHVKSFGFASVAEAKEAKAEDPVRLQVLSFDKLLSTDSASVTDSLNPLSRFEEAGQQELVFPLAVQGGVKSTVKITGMSERWQVAGFDQGHATVINNARKLGQGQPFGLVSVPGLQLAFIETGQEGRRLYYPVTSDEAIGIYKDRPLTGEVLIRILSNAARAAKDRYGKGIDSKRIVN